MANPALLPALDALLGKKNITQETIEAVTGDGAYIVLGQRIATSGRAALVVGQRVHVLWKESRPFLILAHNAQRAQFLERPKIAGAIIEELFVAPDASGLRDVWFRNSEVIAPLKVRPLIKNVEPFSVKWGDDKASMVVETLEAIDNPFSFSSGQPAKIDVPVLHGIKLKRETVRDKASQQKVARAILTSEPKLEFLWTWRPHLSTLEMLRAKGENRITRDALTFNFFFDGAHEPVASQSITQAVFTSLTAAAEKTSFALTLGDLMTRSVVNAPSPNPDSEVYGGHETERQSAFEPFHVLRPAPYHGGHIEYRLRADGTLLLLLKSSVGWSAFKARSGSGTKTQWNGTSQPCSLNTVPVTSLGSGFLEPANLDAHLWIVKFDPADVSETLIWTTTDQGPLADNNASAGVVFPSIFSLTEGPIVDSGTFIHDCTQPFTAFDDFVNVPPSIGSFQWGVTNCGWSVGLEQSFSLPLRAAAAVSIRYDLWRERELLFIPQRDLAFRFGAGGTSKQVTYWVIGINGVNCAGQPVPEVRTYTKTNVTIPSLIEVPGDPTNLGVGYRYNMRRAWPLPAIDPKRILIFLVVTRFSIGVPPLNPTAPGGITVCGTTETEKEPFCRLTEVAAFVYDIINERVVHEAMPWTPDAGWGEFDAELPPETDSVQKENAPGFSFGVDCNLLGLSGRHVLWFLTRKKERAEKKGGRVYLTTVATDDRSGETKEVGSDWFRAVQDEVIPIRPNLLYAAREKAEAGEKPVRPARAILSVVKKIGTTEQVVLSTDTPKADATFELASALLDFRKTDPVAYLTNAKLHWYNDNVLTRVPRPSYQAIADDTVADVAETSRQ